MYEDMRKEHILRIIGGFFDWKISSEEEHKLVLNDINLSEFLDTANSIVLCCTFESKKLSLFNQIPNYVNCKAIVFLKIKNEPIDSNNIHQNIFVSSLMNSPLRSMYYFLKRLYAPSLTYGITSSDALFDPKIEQLILDLEKRLKLVLIHSSRTETASSIDSEAFRDILTLQDEVNFWKKSESTDGILVANIFEPLAMKYLKLGLGFSFKNLEELLDDTFNSLDEVWKMENILFPESRMENIFNMIGNDVVAAVQQKLRYINFWRGDVRKTGECLYLAINVCEKWLQYVKDFTTLYWPHSKHHPWTRNEFVPEYAKGFHRRLNEIHRILHLHELFKNLFNDEEQKSLAIYRVFSPFSVLNPIQHNEITEPLWENAVEAYEIKMSVIENKAAVKLKALLQWSSPSIMQSLQDIIKFRELLIRPKIKEVLESERKELLLRIVNSISSFDPLEECNWIPTMHMSRTVANLIKTKQDEEKIDLMFKAEHILDDLEGYNNYIWLLKSAQEDIKDHQKVLFGTWRSQTLSLIRSKEIGLKHDEIVIYFEEGKLMNVNFSKRLVNLIREIRQLKALGYSIDNSILAAGEEAQKCIMHAKALNKIATFHNTIGDQIIGPQKGMLLKTAKKLSKLVQSQNVIAQKDIEHYIEKLQSVVDTLATENHRLISYHHKISAMVSSLMDYDFYSETSIWYSELSKIRNIVYEVEQEFTNTKTWRNHIDFQLYKIAECHYQHCLQTLSSCITEFHLELFLRDSKINYRPVTTTLRKEYLVKLKGFLLFPKFIPYFGDENIHITLIEHNAKGIYDVFYHANNSFEKLTTFLDSLNKWAAFATVGIDSFITKEIITCEEYEKNLRTSKYLSQELAKLSRSPIKVDCFTVSINQFCDDLQLENSKVWMKIITNLQSLIAADIISLESFIKRGMTIVNQQPTSMEDYIDSYFLHKQLLLDNKEIPELKRKIEDYHSVYKKWAGETLSFVENVNILWLNYQSTLSYFDSSFGSKAESFKNKLLEEESMLVEVVTEFSISWSKFKTDDNNFMFYDNFINTETQLSNVEDKKQRLDLIMEKVTKLKHNFRKLDMECKNFNEIKIIEDEIMYHQSIGLTLQNFRNDLKSLTDHKWIEFRKNVYEEVGTFINLWTERVNEKIQSFTTITQKINEVLHQLQGLLPYLKYFFGDAFNEKHWIELFSIFGKAYKPSIQITFGDILFSIEDVEEKLPELKDLNASASAEIILQQAIFEVDVWEMETKFTVVLHIDTNGNSSMIIKDYKNIINKVGDNQNLIQSIKCSAFSSALEERILLWEKKLTELDQHLRKLMQIQQKWVYLEPILGKGSLERLRYERVTKDLKYIFTQLSKYDYKVVSLLKIKNIGNNLENLLSQLEKCQKSLLNFLEEKRLKFPRFYFVSDNDLLEILGQPNKKSILQSNIKKVFPSIHSVIFSDDTIIGIISSLGEEIQLVKSVNVTETIEDWLEVLSNEIKFALKELLSQCLDNPDPLKYPSQILTLCEQINFTYHCELAIKNKTLTVFQKEIMKKYNEYTSQIVRLSGESFTGSDILLNNKLKSILIDTIYNLDIVNNLIEKNVTMLTDWNWEKCLRFYSDNNDVFVRIADAEFVYTFEYQGNQTKLVHTSLTDNCYLTLTQALHMGFGGNPYGPAGTGKTESVKALGALLGRQVLVFNCDEGLDAHSLTRIMIGIIKCGAWGCFDEFNRLDERTLSLISSQINDIQEAVHSNSKTVILLNKKVEVDFNHGIFITMNPAGKGYGGRQKLPENLKMLFRPVVMSKPDNIDIARVILHCEGFKYAEKISLKLVTLFEMANNTLSYQRHYDWGLRTLKTILSGCGHSLKEYLKKNETASEEAEVMLVVQAVHLNTLSKLTFHDAENFIELIKDIFIDINLRLTGDESLKEALNEAFVALDLTYSEKQVQKCLELYELMKQRMGVVVVGPAFSGKSTIISLLKYALMKLEKVVQSDEINPKSVTRQELLGYIDFDTRQWNNGILTHIAEKVCQKPEGIMCWIHCDGDIDPEWIESLNSVLDDNHLLTLPSGWRILFGDNVHFIFETHEVTHASPATISRMGIIFLNEEDVTINMIVDAWLKRQPDSNLVKKFVADYIYEAVTWIRQNGIFIVEVPMVSLVKKCLILMKNISTKAQFIVSIINGLGSNLIETSKREFCSMVFEIIEGIPTKSNGSVDYFYDELSDTVKCYEMSSNLSVSAFELVNIPPIKVAIDSLLLLIEEEMPALIIGPIGCGKSLMVEECLKNMPNIELISIECNAQITPLHVIQYIQQVCLIVTCPAGRTYRPRNADKLLFHLSDVNHSQIDKWGSRMLVEFLMQLSRKKGFYEEDLEWISIENVNFIYTASSLENVSIRFLSTNFIFHLRSPSAPEMNLIFTKFLKDLYPNIESHENISSLMVNIFQLVQSEFSTSTHVHDFNLRDLSKWCKNLLRYQIQNMETFSEAVLNESRRIFKDNLLSLQDCFNFENYLESMLYTVNTLNYSNHHDVLYVCSTTEQLNSVLKKVSMEQWLSEIKKCFLIYGADNESESPILTQDLLKLIAQIENILTEPGGCVLLGGKVGSGRKTAVKIISKRQNIPIYMPKIGKKYSEKNFKTDLKNIIQITGLNGEQCYFFIEDFQIVEECIYNMLNCIMSTGEVPGLYSMDEYNNLIASLTVTDNSFDGTVVQYFTKRVKDNFHLILSFDIENKNSIQRIIKRPVFNKSIYLIYIREISKEAMTLIPSALLSRFDEANEEFSNNNEAVIETIIRIHNETEKNITLTPLSFYTFIKTYLRIKKIKEENLLKRQKQLRAGIAKITETQSVVEDLKHDAHQQEMLLQEKQAKSKAVLEEISLTMTNASMKKSEMEDLRFKTEEKNKMLQIRKQEIDKELADIEPLLQEARAAVGNIKSEAISEIRSLRAPTSVIRDILEAVLRLMGIQDTSWNSMKTFLSHRGVREEIRLFDAIQIKKEDREAVENVLLSHKDSFLPKNAARASLAAAPLAAWVIANVKYSSVLEKIQPLTQEQHQLRMNIENAHLNIDQLKVGLQSVDESVQKLQEYLRITTKEGAEIEVHLIEVQNRITASEGLVTKLDEEFKIWRMEDSEILSSLTNLWKSCILAAAFVTYLPNETEKVRRDSLKQWRELLDEHYEFSVCNFLSSDRELLMWNHEGLPSDEFSFQNGIIAINSLRSPLLLDPLSTAVSWLLNHFKNQDINIISCHDDNFMTQLELAVRFGKTIILEVDNSIPCAVMSILQENYIFQGHRKMIYIGEKLVDFNDNFKLFMVCHDYGNKNFLKTLLPCPVIDFNTSKNGLMEQLLDSALFVEKPSLERQRLMYIEQEESLTHKLHSMQEDVLETLALAQGDILQNKQLLKSLEETQTSSNEMKITLTQSSSLKKKLNKERELYRPLAEYGANLCFACINLSSINPMYQISITTFKRIFEASLNKNQIVDDMKIKCHNLLTMIYHHVCSSLFKADILTFAIHLTHVMYPEKFEYNEWNVFIEKLISNPIEEKTILEHELPSWIKEDRIPQVLYLQNFLPAMYQKMNLSNQILWKDFMENKDPKSPKECNLSSFQFVLVIQALRPDKLYTTLVKFVLHTLGFKYILPPTRKLNDLYSETVSTEPILIISSAGNDPSKDIFSLASANGNIKIHELAAGPGCEEGIVKCLQETSKNGEWLVLKNLHLILYWLPVFEKEFQSIRPHDNFRIWLSTEQHKNFPSGFLNSCLKITYEAPPGIKRSMEKIYDNWSLEKQLGVNVDAAKVMFVLAWLHAVLQERRIYIPHGWTSFYEFNTSDLACAKDLINRLFSRDSYSNRFKWDCLQGLFEVVIYGGRISNPYDLRVLSTYLKQFFSNSIVDSNFEVALGISIPKSTNIEEHLDIIKHIPEVDSPDYFGLPKNANRIWQREAILNVIKHLKVLDEDKCLGESSSLKDQYSAILTSIIQFWKNIIQENNLTNQEAEEKLELKTEEMPISLFFTLEMMFSNKLVHTINKSLLSIENSLKNELLIEDSIALMAKSIKSQQVPEAWEKLWSGPSNPLIYLQSVMSRAKSVALFYKKWTEENIVFDLSQIYNIERFFAALQQQAARHSNVAIEHLSLHTSLSDKTTPSILEGSVIISGLLLEGATISDNQLTENLEESPSVSLVPEIFLSWKKSKGDDLEKMSSVSIPLYMSDRRDKLITNLLIPCKLHEKNKWILAGTAFYVKT